jgi:hypothetical protein
VYYIATKEGYNMTNKTAGTGNSQIATLTKVYLRIKDARAELATEFKNADKALEEKQEKLKHALLSYCKDEGLESVRTAEGLFYRSVKTRYWAKDWESIYDYVRENDMPELFEKRLSQGVLKSLDESGELPMGVNIDSEYVLTVRKK